MLLFLSFYVIKKSFFYHFTLLGKVFIYLRCHFVYVAESRFLIMKMKILVKFTYAIHLTLKRCFYFC